MQTRWALRRQELHHQDALPMLADLGEQAPLTSKAFGIFVVKVVEVTGCLEGKAVKTSEGNTAESMISVQRGALNFCSSSVAVSVAS